MLTPESLLTLAVAIFIAGATPGPGMLGLVARTLASGFRPAMIMSAGIILGDMFYLTLAVSGMAVIAQTMGEFFIVVKIGGGLYLAWLGVKAWRSPVTPMDADVTAAAKRRERPLNLFISGFLITLSNPKTILFYMAVVPAILDIGAISAEGLIAAGVVIAAVLLVISAGYCYLASRARAVFRSEKALRRLNRTSGALLVGVGAAVATR